MLCRRSLLEAFPHHDNTRQKAFNKLLCNYKASEFYIQITPMYRPNIEIDEEFKAKYPKETQKFESWVTNSIPEDFQKLETIIDLLRKKLNMLSKNADKAYANFKKNSDKEMKLRSKVHAFYNFGSISYGAKTRECLGNLNSAFWKKSETECDKETEKLQKEKEKYDKHI